MRKVILYGAGNFGRQAYKLYGDRVAYFVDKIHQGEEINGISVIGMGKLKEIYQDYEVIVTPVEARARGEIGMELGKDGIPFSCFRSMHGLLHIYGNYPEIFYEYESSTMDFRMTRTLDNYRDMFLAYEKPFLGKSLDIWIWEFDEAFAAFECMQDMGLPHIHGYATMFPVRDQVIPIPDYYACCKEETYPYDFSPGNCRKAARQPWKDSRCFWRGNIFTSMEHRSLLWLMGQKHPEVLRIERSDQGEHVPMLEQARYKYLIDVRGVGWTDRVKILMQLGRPLLLVDRPYREWYFDWLVPMEHYVPIKEDLSDLLEKIQYLNEHPEVYGRIVESAGRFVQEYLTGEPVMKYLRDVTLQYDVVSEISQKTYPWNRAIYQRGELFG